MGMDDAEYETLMGQHHHGVITGKPILWEDRKAVRCDGSGCIYVTREGSQGTGHLISQAKHGDSGFGMRGQYAACWAMRSSD